MKKGILVLFVGIVIFIVVFVSWYFEKSSEKKKVLNYNSEYEQYIDGQITGVDLTTIINKAIDNNESYEISKDEKGAYINDNKYYTEVYVQLEEEGEVFLMEALEITGMSDFTRYFGSLNFECVDVKYHDNGRISSLYYKVS